ncbi:alpha/beta hydrolase [Clostridium sp. MSJ-8]|uniref:alpha/beta hydrolase n=1 Tax=Clostridium sp. MSJ-8 TaxID=2841510 RepID=UPI001C0ED085|nr:alpha/beta hydrolase [Clostridium sp. MSJ-8]MBU5487931.1 alpha/beta hydrolase [Clostridium sp. MSJ-8]
MKKINMIPESNGLYRVNMKEKVNKTTVWKRIALVIVCIFIFGFLFQQVSNFIGNEKIASSIYYAKVNNNKYEYNYGGSGQYNLVFDGDIGTTLDQWSEVASDAQKNYSVSTFVYNRQGYGFSNFSMQRTVEEQAQDLKILLRKAGITKNIILIGEGYGSLVLTSFAKQFPEVVSGVILINPLNEDEIKSDKFKESIKGTYRKSKFEVFGTYFGITTLLEKLNMAYSISDYDKVFQYKEAKEQYDILSKQTNYRKAISSEFGNLYNYDYKCQEEGILSDKPLYIISSAKDEKLTKLGSEELTTVKKIKESKDISVISNKSEVLDSISSILKQRKKIDKNNSQG